MIVGTAKIYFSYDNARFELVFHKVINFMTIYKSNYLKEYVTFNYEIFYVKTCTRFK